MHLDKAVFRNAAAQWASHNAPRLGAALAFYSVLSLAPAVVLIVAVCGFTFGRAAVQGQIFFEVRNVIGDQGAAAVQAILKSADRPASGIGASIVGFVTLLVGASGAFVELRGTLNYIWDAPTPPGFKLGGFIRDRFFSFAMVLGCGLLLMASLTFSVFIHAASTFGARFITVPAQVLEGANALITFVATAILFALIYKIIPDVHVDWREVTVGSLITAALFGIGRFLIGLYLGKAGVTSAYGAAGSLIAVLVWAYYSAQIFLYGAEVTHEYSRRSRASDGTSNASQRGRAARAIPTLRPKDER